MQNIYETDQAVKARIKERFDILQEMTMAAASGKIRGLIVSGAPGTGKSYEVENTLKYYSVGSDEVGFGTRYAFIKGYMTAAGFYRKLLDYSGESDVLVMDDCDSIFSDEVSLNILKAALDTTQKRVLSWETASRDHDIPKNFIYRGSLIFITNINFEEQISNRSKLSMHLEAMMDRCFYLDTTISSLRDKLLRIEQVAIDFGMLESRGLHPEEAQEIMQFIRENAIRFRNLSLRKVIQLSSLYIAGGDWKRKAEITLMRD